MSKLNRKEFKELLTEWKQNFINERSRWQHQHVPSDLKGDLIPMDTKTNKTISKFIKDYISSRSDQEPWNRLSDVANDYLDFGVALPKIEEVFDMLIVYFENFGDTEAIVDLQKAKSYNNDEPVILHVSGNDFTLESPNPLEDYSWLLHDMEHSIFAKQAEIFIPQYVRSVKGSMEKNIFDYGFSTIRNFFSNSEESALMEFFKNINFTSSATSGDLHASVFGFCISKMSDASDFEIINNSAVSLENKELLKNLFQECWPISKKMKSQLLEKFKDLIIIIYNF
jgi:hypothetical protein